METTAQRSALVVEDDELLRRSLQSIMTHLGWRCVAAPNLRNAKLHVSRVPFAALVVDLGLPDGDGLDLIRCVRAKPSDARIVVVTGAGGTETGVEATKAGANAVLDKPVGLDELRRALEGETSHVDLTSIHSMDWVEYQHTKRIFELLGRNLAQTALAIGRGRNWVKEKLDRGEPRR